MDDLVAFLAFLNARLDEDQATAGTARKLREAEFKRAILAEWKAVRKLAELTGLKPDGYRDWILRRMGAVYSDHPDYRSDWKP